MIKRTTVRRARMTGYQKKNRRVKGNIYLNRKWVGKRVAIVLYQDLLQMNREIRTLKRVIALIKRLTK